MNCNRRRARGFTYWLLLFALAVMGVLLSSMGQIAKQTTAREKEAELIFIGQAFSQALTRYARFTPAGQPDAPASLEELLEDKRFPYPVRHLRRLYRDPMTGTHDWGVILDGHGRIIAIHSTSDVRPLRTAPLPAWIGVNQTGQISALSSATEVEANHYSDWLFTRQNAVRQIQNPHLGELDHP